MGRGIAQLPNEDPARLGRVQDAKWRSIGVRCPRSCYECLGASGERRESCSARARAAQAAALCLTDAAAVE